MSKDKQEKPYIMVYKDFMKDERVESRDQFIYLLIKGFSNQRLGSVSIVSIDILTKLLGIIANSKNRLGVKESLEKLNEIGILELYEDVSCKELAKEVKNSDSYFARINDNLYLNGYFSKIYFEDIQKLMMIDDKSKAKLFAVYYNIVSRIYDSISSDKYTLPNIDDIEAETGINRKTISKYIEILMDNKLIYYETMRLAKDKTKNVYSRWDDRGAVNDFISRGGADLSSLYL